VATLIPWTRPRGAVHDLTHLLSLSNERTHLLCLSDREMYVLSNWLALDLEFESRYALTQQYNGYEPLDRESGLWSVWRDFVNSFQIGATDMSCDLLAVLENIREELTASNAQLSAIATAITNKVIPDHNYTTLLDNIGDAIGAIDVPNPNWPALLTDISGSINTPDVPAAPNWIDLFADVASAVTGLPLQNVDWDGLMGTLGGVIESTRAPFPEVTVRNMIAPADPCCGPAADLPLQEPDLETDIVEPSGPLCDRATAFASEFAKRAIWFVGILRGTTALNFGILAAYVATFNVELGAVLAILSSLPALDFSGVEGTLDNYQTSLVDAIRCAIWQNDTAATGYPAVLYAIENYATTPTGWPALGTLIVKSLVAKSYINDVYNGGYQVLPEYENSSCAGCDE